MFIQKGLQDNITQDLQQISQRDQSAVEPSPEAKVNQPQEETTLTPDDNTAITQQLQGTANGNVDFSPTISESSREMFSQANREVGIEAARVQSEPASTELSPTRLRSIPRYSHLFNGVVSRYRNGDQAAGRQLVYSSRIRHIAQNNPDQARNIYETLNRMAQENLNFDDLSDEEQQYLQLIGIRSQDDIENAGGIDELFDFIEPAIDVIINPDNYSEEERQAINELYEQAEAEGLFDQIAQELDMMLPELDLLMDSSTVGEVVESTAEEEQAEAEFEPTEVSNFEELLAQRQQQLFLDQARTSLERQRFENELAGHFINKLNADVKRTDEHARELLEERQE